MIFPHNFELLLLSLRADDTVPVRAADMTEQGKPDWDDLLKRASFHRIEPQLLALTGMLPAALVPESVRLSLREAVHANLEGQIKYVAEFFSIEEWLRSAGITVIPYKGFWLGESAYGNLADRMSSDLDLFIYFRDLNEIRRIMTEKGYAGHRNLDELTDDYIKDELAEYNFDRYEEGVCQAHVEFHWRSSMSFYRMGITLDDMKSQVTIGDFQGRELRVFSPAAALLMVVMHHGGKECYLQLRQALDIAQIIRNNPEIDYDWLLAQSARFHMTTLLLLGVRLAHMLTGVAVPAQLAGIQADKRISRLAAGRMRLMAKPAGELAGYKERLSSWIFRIQSRDGRATKAHLTIYTLRKVIAPRMVPVKWRHLFFNPKIRRGKDGN